MAEIAVLLTEMTFESPKSKFLVKNMAAFLPNNMAVSTKIAPGKEGRLGDRYAGSFYEKKHIYNFDKFYLLKN